MAKPKFKTAYDAYERRTKNFLGDNAISMTEQSHKEECDINNIVAKYQKTGVIDHRSKYEPQYGFATSADLQTALNTIKTADNMFNDLPSSIRDRFNNSPGAFLDFVQDKDNHQEMFEMGLAKSPPEAKTEPVEAPKTQPSAEGETA